MKSNITYYWEQRARFTPDELAEVEAREAKFLPFVEEAKTFIKAQHPEWIEPETPAPLLFVPTTRPLMYAKLTGGGAFETTGAAFSVETLGNQFITLGNLEAFALLTSGETASAPSTLVHEMTHWFQQGNGVMAQWQHGELTQEDIEKQAYRVENAWREANGFTPHNITPWGTIGA